MTGIATGCRLTIATILLTVLSWVDPSCLGAQPPSGTRDERARDERGGRGGRDQFYEAMREVFRDTTPNRELVELVWSDAVRAEIGLSTENHHEIEKAFRGAFESVMELREQLADQKLDKLAWREKILAIQRPVDDKVMQMLADPQIANFDRLIGIYVQNRGFRSAANAAVATRIGLVGEDLESFQRARSDVWHRLMDKNRDQMGSLIRDGQRDKIAKLFEEAEQKLDQELALLLTEQQKSALKNLEGEEFKLPRSAPDFRGRGLRDGGRNGDGRPRDPRGERSRDDNPKDGRGGDDQARRSGAEKGNSKGCR